MNPISLRLLNQQIACPQFDCPAEVVSYMGAMQAQEYRLMRGTWQLVCAEHYWPLLCLCAPRAMAVTKGWMNSNKISIPDDEVASIRDILVRTAADGGSVTKEDFFQELRRTLKEMTAEGSI